MHGHVTSILNMFRTRLSAAMAFTGFCSHVYCRETATLSSLGIFSGLFLLSAGASALNQIQERIPDAYMHRTEHRVKILQNTPPLLLTAVVTFLISAGFVLLGLSALGGNGKIVLLAAVISVLLYNVAYTYLKPLTFWSIIPGVLNGASPVVMGWIAAGGGMLAPAVWLMAGFMIVWQIPHYFFILFRQGDDYRKSGFKVLSAHLTELQMKRVAFFWVLCCVFSAFLLPLSGLLQNAVLLSMYFLAGFVLLIYFIWLFSAVKSSAIGKNTFRLFNLYAVFVFAVLLLDQGL